MLKFGFALLFGKLMLVTGWIEADKSGSGKLYLHFFVMCRVLQNQPIIMYYGMTVN